MKEIIVLSRQEAERRDFGLLDAVISIFGTSAPDDDTPATLNARRVLRLQFDDITETSECNNCILMTDTQADEIIKFVKEQESANRFFVHCFAGISRSAGVAAGLSGLGLVVWPAANDKVWGADGMINRFVPNPHVKTLLMRKGWMNE